MAVGGWSVGMVGRFCAFLFVACVSGPLQAAQDDCANDPARTHVSRIIAADSVSAPIYGHFLNDQEDRAHLRSLALRDKEVILTFDDGPLPASTGEVLDILDRHCVKATFFSVGRMAQSNPKMLQEIDRRGHTVGSHTYTHPIKMDEMSLEDIKFEIEKGFIAVSDAMGKPIAPFYRFPGLRDSKRALDYLASRNISVWSVDVISGDTEPNSTSAKIRHDVVSRLKQQGRGIVLMHDIKKITVNALDGILTDLENDGFRVVHVVSNAAYQPNPEIKAKTDAQSIPMAQMTITGRLVAAAKDQIKDGSVNVMHTEWIDLQQASEALDAQAAKPAARSIPTPTAGVKPVSQYSANGWVVGPKVQ